MKKLTLATTTIMAILLMAVTFSITATEVSAKKTKTKTLVVMEGGTRVLPCDTFKAKVKISSKTKVTVLKNQKSGVTKVVPKTYDRTYGFLAKGKKAGKTTITVTTPSTKYIYKVTVISKKSVQKASKKALTKYAKTLKDTKQCAYMDFNGDGVKELYHDGSFTYYNYVVKKVVTKPYNASEGNTKFTQVSSLTIDPKTYMMLAIPSKEIMYGTPDDSEYEDFSGIIYGRFAFMNREMVFDIENDTIDVLKYAKPKAFVGESYVEGTDYYCYHIDGYDQDDYWYMPMTKEELDANLKTCMPNGVEVIFTETPIIK